MVSLSSCMILGSPGPDNFLSLRINQRIYPTFRLTQSIFHRHASLRYISSNQSVPFYLSNQSVPFYL
jgi:hypothetical protein